MALSPFNGSAGTEHGPFSKFFGNPSPKGPRVRASAHPCVIVCGAYTTAPQPRLRRHSLAVASPILLALIFTAAPATPHVLLFFPEACMGHFSRGPGPVTGSGAESPSGFIEIIISS